MSQDRVPASAGACTLAAAVVAALAACRAAAPLKSEGVGLRAPDDSPAVRALLEAAARSEPDGYDGCYGGGQSFAIIVEDSLTGRPLAHGARLIWRAGRTVDTTYASPTRMGDEPVVLQGPFGRPGTYDVVIRREGYRDWSYSGIRVPQGAERCSVTSENIVLGARLQPCPRKRWDRRRQQ